MKTFLQHLLTIFATIFIYGFLLTVHHNFLSNSFEQCKADLIKENDYQSVHQAMKCAKNSLPFRILATMIYEEGTFLEGNEE